MAPRFGRVERRRRIIEALYRERQTDGLAVQTGKEHARLRRVAEGFAQRIVELDARDAADAVASLILIDGGLVIAEAERQARLEENVERNRNDERILVLQAKDRQTRQFVVRLGIENILLHLARAVLNGRWRTGQPPVLVERDGSDVGLAIDGPVAEPPSRQPNQEQNRPDRHAHWHTRHIHWHSRGTPATLRGALKGKDGVKRKQIVGVLALNDCHLDAHCKDKPRASPSRLSR